MTNSQLRLSVLRTLDLTAIERDARAETRRREVALPPIGGFRWWARRTRTVTEAVLEAAAAELGEALLVADPFAGGGTIPLMSVAAGHRAYAQDVNPWATRSMTTMLSPPSADALADGASQLEARIQPLLTSAYASNAASRTNVSQTLRVLEGFCDNCGERIRAFPHALVSLTHRKDSPAGGLIDEAFLACPAGHLFMGRKNDTQQCPYCDRLTSPSRVYTKGRIVTCHECAAERSLSHLFRADDTRWQVALIERVSPSGRELSLPTDDEITQADSPTWVASDLAAITDGAETRVLRRHGYSTWSDAYPVRQQHVLREILREIGLLSVSTEVRAALFHAAVGTAEMAGHLSRWDRWYLKSYEAMARHRFGITTLAVEPNVWGAGRYGRGTMKARLRLMKKGAKWLRHRSGDRTLAVRGPISATSPRKALARNVNVLVVEGSSERLVLPQDSVDLVFTDPPYHDDVRYGDLSQPLRAWADLGTGPLRGEAVVNLSTSDGDYSDLLESVFRECHRVLKQEGHLVFSYSNRQPRAWVSLFSALQSAGFHVVGYTIVHSENETDPAKNGGRHCNLDMLIDAVPSPRPRVRRFRPGTDQFRQTAELRFLEQVGLTALDVGVLNGDWADTMTKRLRETEFVSGRPPQSKLA